MHSTVWYRFVSPTAAPIGVSSFGSSYDTVLGIYSGSTLRSLSFIACSNDAGTTKQGMVAWMASAGTTYFVQAGTLTEAKSGTLKLRLAYGVRATAGESVPTTGPLPVYFLFPAGASTTSDTQRQEVAAKDLSKACFGPQCFTFGHLSVDWTHESGNGDQIAYCFEYIFLGEVACDRVDTL